MNPCITTTVIITTSAQLSSLPSSSSSLSLPPYLHQQATFSSSQHRCESCSDCHVTTDRDTGPDLRFSVHKDQHVDPVTSPLHHLFYQATGIKAGLA
jgi:hypothetical protein